MPLVCDHCGNIREVKKWTFYYDGDVAADDHANLCKWCYESESDTRITEFWLDHDNRKNLDYMPIQCFRNYEEYTIPRIVLKGVSFDEQ